MRFAIMLAFEFIFGCDDPCRPNCLFVAPQGSTTSWHYSFPLGFSSTSEQRFSVVVDCSARANESWFTGLSEKEAWKRACSEPYPICTPSNMLPQLNQTCAEARQ